MTFALYLKTFIIFALLFFVLPNKCQFINSSYEKAKYNDTYFFKEFYEKNVSSTSISTSISSAEVTLSKLIYNYYVNTKKQVSVFPKNKKNCNVLKTHF